MDDQGTNRASGDMTNPIRLMRPTLYTRLVERLTGYDRILAEEIKGTGIINASNALCALRASVVNAFSKQLK
jgi:hypothetical protein